MPNYKKQYDDDDGRTVADMSDLSRQPLIMPRFNKSEEKEEEQSKTQNDDNYEMSSSERRAFIGGALGATLAVGSVFAIVGAVVIFLITRLT